MFEKKTKFCVKINLQKPPTFAQLIKTKFVGTSTLTNVYTYIHTDKRTTKLKNSKIMIGKFPLRIQQAQNASKDLSAQKNEGSDRGKSARCIRETVTGAGE